MRVVTFLITLHFNHLMVCVGGKSKVTFNTSFNNIVLDSFELATQDSHPILVFVYSICIFLMNSESVEKIMTALFKLVWNTQKSTSTNLFEYHGEFEMFLNIENVLVKSNLKYTALFFFLQILQIRVKLLLTRNMRNETKQNWH